MKKPAQSHHETDAVREALFMETKIVAFTFDDEIRLKRIVIDRDKEDAFEFAKELLGRISALSNRRLKNHLDAG